MRSVGRTILQGLLAILPIGLTLYVVSALAVWAEEAAGSLLSPFLPDGTYIPGLGLIVAVVILYLTGLAVNALVVRRFLNAGDTLLERIPVVKTLYVAIRDFTRFFPSGQGHGDLKRVVLVPVGTGKLIGFVTSETGAGIVDGPDAADVIAIYLPMSYMIGGYTLLVPRRQIEPSPLTVEAAMRLVLMGGVHADSNRPPVAGAALLGGLMPAVATTAPPPSPLQAPPASPTFGIDRAAPAPSPDER